jgi:Family of unknown function (DUF6959)
MARMAEPISEHAELLTPPGNYAVVQLPGRKFPGVVFQGDSLAALCEQTANLAEECPDALDLSVSLHAIPRLHHGPRPARDRAAFLLPTATGIARPNCRS